MKKTKVCEAGTSTKKPGKINNILTGEKRPTFLNETGFIGK